jgi:CO/xanthine dehydrogenase Mo-binding subunit
MTAAPIIEIVESGQGNGPRGAKGAGEVSAVAAPIAICHALYDALGAQFDLTTTPQQIIERLDMIRQGQEGDDT